ncbi:hypothetical protein, conserved in T. vivax [Trypanosoma vivax Y486]|uniref:Uncharacterized protein n=1 Tax=Trypanosoma vivax (strain Y486) TaxID=1055687 RepID=F9WRR8_TRYVY|nr:hypothetical protein, conserved in T. vivax [Trypanosoma vivax Y486]|eukprot:CCD20252.1 hypothetical protein, conserved in T. vivax [Trypanosoma vivax Y486]
MTIREPWNKEKTSACGRSGGPSEGRTAQWTGDLETSSKAPLPSERATAVVATPWRSCLRTPRASSEPPSLVARPPDLMPLDPCPISVPHSPAALSDEMGSSMRKKERFAISTFTWHAEKGCATRFHQGRGDKRTSLADRGMGVCLFCCPSCQLQLRWPEVDQMRFGGLQGFCGFALMPRNRSGLCGDVFARAPPESQRFCWFICWLVRAGLRSARLRGGVEG